MKKLHLVTVLSAFLFASLEGLAQSLSVSYAPSDGTSTITLKSLTATADNGYLLCGSVRVNNGTSSGNQDVLVIKTDGNGVVAWAKQYGVAIDDDIVSRVVAVSDGYILGGYTASSSHSQYLNDILLIKIDLSGNLIWTKIYGTSVDEKLYDLMLTKDGNIAFSGKCQHEVGVNRLYGYAYIAKADLNGNITWFTPACAISCLPVPNTLMEDTDGGFIGGLTYRDGLWKVNSSGVFQWYSAGGPTPYYRYLQKAEKRKEGGFVLYGNCTVTSPSTTNKFIIQKFTADGRYLNSKLYETPYDSDSYIDLMQADQTSDLGYTCQLQLNDNSTGRSKYGFFLLDSAGAITQQRLVTSTTSFPPTYRSGEKPLLLANEFVRVVANRLEKIDYLGATLKSTPTTSFVSNYNYTGTYSQSFSTTYGKCTNTYSAQTATFYEQAIAVTGKALGLENETLGGSTRYLYPNPSQGTAILQLPDGEESADVLITDVLGREVLSKKGLSATQPFSLEGLPLGLYHYQIGRNGKILYSNRLIVNR